MPLHKEMLIGVLLNAEILSDLRPCFGVWPSVRVVPRRRGGLVAPGGIASVTHAGGWVEGSE